MRTSVAKKSFLLLATVLVTGSAWSEWVKVGESINGSSFYIDLETIRKDGNQRKVWSVRDFKQRDNNGQMSSRSRDEFDCKGERQRMLSLTTHDEPMTRGKTLLSGQVNGDWADIPPGTVVETILKIVCAK